MENVYFSQVIYLHKTEWVTHISDENVRFPMLEEKASS